MGCPIRSFAPAFHRPQNWRSNAVVCHEASVQLNGRRNIIVSLKGRSQTKKRERFQRSKRVNAQRLIAQFSGVTPVKWNNFQLAWDANSRALLQLSVRTRAVSR
jgi:hypothetical protein